MKKIYSCLLILLAVWLAAGCRKQLNALPTQQPVEGNAIVDLASADRVMRGVYYRFANASKAATDWSSHQRLPAFMTGLLGNGYNTVRIEKNEYAEKDELSILWIYSYRLINEANGLLKGVDALPADPLTGKHKQELLGQGRFMRAYGHFKLLSYFAHWYDSDSPYGILLRTAFVTPATIAQPRSTVKESYDQVLEDIDFAINNAPDSSDPGTVNRWTAKLLKMRVLLCRAHTGDQEEVIRLGTDIIQNSPYILEPFTRDIFYKKGLASKEVMLGIAPQPGQEQYYNNTSAAYLGANRLTVALPACKKLFENDPRQSWMIGELAEVSGVYIDTGYYFIKYARKGDKVTPVAETVYAFRLTEVYLLLAEALVRSGQDLPKARNLLRTVMQHGQVTDFTAINNAITANDLLKQLYFEVCRNLVAEDGAEWMALLRFPLETVQIVRPTIRSKKQYTAPVPFNELQNNPIFGSQNPGYPGK
jgi:tetratricopeptide (TPR) repeat protein